MLKKKLLALVLFIFGIKLILLFGVFSITGGIITEESDLISSVFSFIGIILVIFSFVLFVSRHGLDALIIPTGPSHEEDIERTKRAYREHKEHGKDYFVISGELGDKKLSESQRADIYRELRKHGVKPSQISIEGKSRNTVENMIYSLEKIKERGGREVGISSYPGHLDRFKDIFERARDEGIVDENFHLHRLPTRTRKNQSAKESIYETLSGILHRYKMRHGIKEALKSEDESIIKYLKKAGNYALSLFK